MHAIHIASDDTHSLSWRDGFTRPACGPEDVVIKVGATAVNRADLLQRRGLYPVPAGASPILGLECAGTIIDVGANVDGWEVGDRVCALLPGGGYAEYVESPAELLLPVPDTMSLVEAAAIPEVFYTAFLNLFLEGELKAGERLLIHAGASGVGTAAIQLARLAGVEEIFATASAAKLPALAEFGVVAIDRHDMSFLDVVREEAEAVDVILDPVAGAYLEDNLRALDVGGRLVVIGLLGGGHGKLDLSRLLMKRIRVIGSVLRSRSIEEKAAITLNFLNEVWPHFASGYLQPVIDSVFPIGDADEAHALLASNETLGKVVLRIS